MRSVCFACLFAISAQSAQAGSGLGQEPRISEGLIAVAIAYEVGRVCPDIEARRWRGMSYLMQLRGVARDLGYSNDEIDSFINDSAEKARLERNARARLAQKGARRDNVAEHCAVGRREIAAQSVIGKLLKD